jgi:hypothetical protein
MMPLSPNLQRAAIRIGGLLAEADRAEEEASRAWIWARRAEKPELYNSIARAWFDKALELRIEARRLRRKALGTG